MKAGIVVSKGGKLRLLKRAELSPNWNPATDEKLTVWEVTQYLIREYDKGEDYAGVLYKTVGALAETARDLAYRLYNVCERKGWNAEAFAYNSLVVAWPTIIERSRVVERPIGKQEPLSL